MNSMAGHAVVQQQHVKHSKPVLQEQVQHLFCDREEEQYRTHGSGDHAKQLWIQAVHVSKLPGRLHPQTTDKLRRKQQKSKLKTNIIKHVAQKKD